MSRTLQFACALGMIILGLALMIIFSAPDRVRLVCREGVILADMLGPVCPNGERPERFTP